MTAQGSARVFIEKFGDRYVYCKPATTVHNLVFGKLWTDNDGKTPLFVLKLSQMTMPAGIV